MPISFVMSLFGSNERPMLLESDSPAWNYRRSKYVNRHPCLRGHGPARLPQPRTCSIPTIPHCAENANRRRAASPETIITSTRVRMEHVAVIQLALNKCARRMIALRASFRIYRIFYGLLLLAFFIVTQVEGWQSVQKHA